MLDLASEPRGGAAPEATPPPPPRRAPVGCPRCRAPLDRARLDSGPQTCPSCRTRFEAVRFDPPLARAAAVAGVGEAGPEAGTACANHEGNLATTHCGRCGLLICDLCRIETQAMTLCPACFARLSAAGSVGGRTRMLDWVGLSVLSSFFGLSTCFGAILLGPAGAFLAWRGIRQRRDSGDSIAGAVVAMVVALLAAAVGVAFIGAMVYDFATSGS